MARLSASIPFTFYVGNLTRNKWLFREFPIQTDDRPLIEYLSPKTVSNQSAGNAKWFTGARLGRLSEKLLLTVPPGKDPYLRDLDERQVGYVTGGLSFYNYMRLEHAGRTHGDRHALAEARKWLRDYVRRIGLR